MADRDSIKEGKEFYLDKEIQNGGFFLKGSSNYDWGMKHRLSKIFNPKSGRTIMLAFDHGYIMGATSGLERLDVTIPPIAEHADVLMATRGGLRTCINPESEKAIALRVSSGSSVLREDISKEVIAVDIEDAIRMNASCIAVQTYIGSENECQTIQNVSQAVNMGNRYGVPVLGVIGVGKDMSRTPQFFLTAVRLVAEMGAHIIKTYYCEDFEKIVAACPVPIVVAGGKKIPEKDALELAFNAISKGAAGVDMGRNVFQADNPIAMIQAIKKVVHEGSSAEEAYAFYLDIK
ncbi:3-hydroxy-5-phosphonooxypentane-2,4-dione thiolase [Clostridium sp. DL1XJH146]